MYNCNIFCLLTTTYCSFPLSNHKLCATPSSSFLASSIEVLRVNHNTLRTMKFGSNIEKINYLNPYNLEFHWTNFLLKTYFLNSNTTWIWLCCCWTCWTLLSSRFCFFLANTDLASSLTGPEKLVYENFPRPQWTIGCNTTRITVGQA